MAEQLQSASLGHAAPPETFFGADVAEWLHPDLAEIGSDTPGLKATFAGCAQFSPFLRALMERHTDFLRTVADSPADQVVAGILAPLEAPFETQLALRTALRHARQKMMLYLALSDCGGTIGLAQLTRGLSDLADAALNAALRFELAELAGRDRLAPEAATPETCGIGILGLGKLGGRELNYSSDIDVVAYLEPDRFAYTGPKDQKSAAIQLMRKTFGHISARTAEGFVFRVDLRLRPDPGSTPIVMTLDAAEIYYQSQGLTWERAAMIKARHCAGDPSVTGDFLERVRPFIWRRHLDFAAIDDVLAMKERVHDHHNHDEDIGPCAGYDVKLGHGGIREIEFFAQIHQLISGGRRPDLQVKATCDVLGSLNQAGELAEEHYDTLTKAYQWLRCVEHRLQMVQDEQTHCLPEAEDDVAHVAQFLGLASAQDLYDQLAVHTAKVSALFDAVLSDEEKPAAVNTGALPAQTKAIIERWQSGQYRSLDSARARQLLARVLPELLYAFSQTPDPAETALIFDAFLSQLPAGVQIFSLLDANKPLIPLMANIMGQSPELSGQLARRPVLFEGLINEPLHQPMPDLEGLIADLTVSLSGARDYEAALDFTRIWNGEARFQTGVRLLEGLCSPAETRRAYSDIAKASIRSLLGHVEAEFAKSHGRIEGADFGVIALGSFGACELVTSSDLDLTFLYSVPDPNAQSDGPRPLTVNSYYARLAQRVITGITSLTSEGRLYEVDMRLRPSGRSGIIAVSVDAYAAYHKSDAWLWERMSLSKARFVAGPDALKETFNAIRTRVLGEAVAGEDVRAALWAMRQKLRDAAPPGQGLWSLKAGDGGLTDADFLLEGLLLAQGANGAQAARWEEWWDVAGPTDRQDVYAARSLLMDARSVRALLLPNTVTPQDAMEPARDKLASLLGFADFEAASEAIKSARATVFAGLSTLLPPPGDPP